MNVLDYINRGGKKIIQNPEYNPNSKKNTVPQFIEVDDYYNNTDPNYINKEIQDNIRNNELIPYEEAKKYEKYGINYRRELASSVELDIRLADAQSDFSKIANSLVQTASELTLGLAGGFASLADMIGNALTDGDNDYQNPITRILDSAKQAVNEWAPIYVDPTRNSIDNGGLTNIGWWASNFPNVASTLSLMVPAIGLIKLASTGAKLLAGAGNIAKGAKKINAFSRKAVRTVTGAEKALDEGRKLNRIQSYINNDSFLTKSRQLLESGVNATLSRAMENYQEAREVWDDTYPMIAEKINSMTDKEYQAWVNQNKNELGDIDINDKNAVAKKIASNAADLTNRIDWTNIVFDVIEFYSLRNALRGIGRNTTPSGKVLAKNKEMAKQFGKTDDEIKEILKNTSKWNKVLNKGKEWGYNIGRYGLISLNEGAEEAVNYIAQQEGINYAKSLLEGTYNKGILGIDANGLKSRLADYIKDPSLHDSAFWGILGGMIFQGVGSKARQISYNADLKRRKKEENLNEEAKVKNPWYKLEDLPEIKRMMSDLESRKIDSEKLLQDIDDIVKNNKKPGTDRQFESDIEKEEALNEVIDNFVTTSTIRSMNAGTLKLLKAFINDKNVRQGFIDRGVIDQEGADNFITKLVNKIEDTEHRYNSELTTLNYASANISRMIPMEYIQLMASENIRTENAINQLKNEEDKINLRIAELESMPGVATQIQNDGNINYQRLHELAGLLYDIGRLRTERKNIQDNKDSVYSIVRTKQIDKQINELEKDLNNEELVYVTAASLRYGINEDGTINDTDTDDYFKYVDKLIVSRTGQTPGKIQTILGIEGLNDNSRKALTDEQINNYKKLVSDITKLPNLKNINPELDSLIKRRGVIKRDRTSLNALIHRSVDDIKDYTNELDYTYSVAKQGAIALAGDTVSDLYSKYKQPLREIVLDYYNNGVLDNKNNLLNPTEYKNLKDALDILAITNDSDITNAALLDIKFKNQDETEYSRGENDGKEEESYEDSTKPRESSPEVNNNITLQDNSGVLVPTNNGDNTYEFNVNENSISGSKYISDTEFFDKEDGVIIASDPKNYTIELNPIVTYSEKDGKISVKSKGRLKKQTINDSTQETIETQTPEDSTTPSPSYTPMESLLEGLESSENISPENNKTESVYDYRGPDLHSQLQEEALTNFDNILNDNKNSSYDEIVNLLNEEANRLKKDDKYKGISKNSVDNIIDVELEESIILAKELKDGEDKVFYSSLIELLCEPGVTKNKSDYLNKVDNFIQSYLNKSNLTEIDGKYYFDVEGLLRELKQKINSKPILSKIADSISIYLSNNRNSKYVIIDSNLLQTDTLLSILSKPLDVRRQELLANKNIYSIDLISELKHNSEDKTNHIKAIQNVKVGDKLKAEIINIKSDKTRKIIRFVDNNSNVVGSIPVVEPNSSRNGDEFSFVNEGWNEDIFKKANLEHVVSACMDFYISIIDRNDKDALELNKLIYKHAYDKEIHKKEKRNEFLEDIEKFKNNKLIQSAIKRNILVGDNFEEALNHLTKLWQYIGCNTVDPNEEDNDFIKKSIVNWFDKIWNSYEFSTMIAENPNNVNISIISSTGKEFLRAVNNKIDGDNRNDLSKLNTPDKAFAGGVNLDQQKISAVDNTTGRLLIAGGGSMSGYGLSIGSTFVTVDLGDGRINQVHAYPNYFNDKSVGKDAKDFIKELENNIISIINSEDIDSFTQLRDLFLSAFNSDNVPFLGNIQAFIKNGNIKLYQKTTNTNLVIKDDFSFKLGSNEYVNSKTDLINSIKEFISNVKLNINYAYINGDNGSPINGGLARYKNGEFIISVGNYTKSFKSFNDFVLSNNLVRVNTKINPNTKDNYESITEQKIKDDKYHINIEFTPSEKLIDITTPVRESDEVLNILSDDNIEHKGNAILDYAITTLTDEAKEQLKDISPKISDKNTINRLKNLSLFPKNIIFAEDFNTLNNDGEYVGYNAEYNPNTDTVTVGYKWLNQFNNPNTRNEALRRLIHEELHAKLQDNDVYVDRIKSIYDEYKSVISDKSNEAFKKLRDSNPQISDEKFNEVLDSFLFNEYKDENTRFEEFLIESITNSDLAQILNAIDAKGYKTYKKRNLFQAILELLSEIFGWNVRTGSLYEKELSVLRDVVGRNKQTVDDTVQEEPTDTSELDAFINDNLVNTFGGIDYSSRNENLVENTSLSGFADTLPMSSRADFISLTQNGGISIVC